MLNSPIEKATALVSLVATAITIGISVSNHQQTVVKARASLALEQSQQKHEIRLKYLDLALTQKLEAGDKQKIMRFLRQIDDDTTIQAWANQELALVDSFQANKDSLYKLAAQLDSLKSSGAMASVSGATSTTILGHGAGVGSGAGVGTVASGSQDTNALGDTRPPPPAGTRPGTNTSKAVTKINIKNLEQRLATLSAATADAAQRANVKTTFTEVSTALRESAEGFRCHPDSVHSVGDGDRHRAACLGSYQKGTVFQPRLEGLGQWRWSLVTVREKNGEEANQAQALQVIRCICRE